MARRFGWGKGEEVRLVFQRTLMLGTLIFLTFQLPLLIISGNLLVMAGLPKSNALAAERMTWITIPGYFAMLVYEVVYRTLFAAGAAWPALISGTICSLLSITIALLSFFVLNWGTTGLTLAVCIPLVVTALFASSLLFSPQFPFVKEYKLLKPRVEALDEWKELFVQYGTSIIQAFMRRFISDFVVIIGGLIDSTQLGAANVLRRYSFIISLSTHAFSTPCITNFATFFGMWNG